MYLNNTLMLQIFHAAQENGWQLESITATEPMDGEVKTQGVVMFRKVQAVPDDIAYGTAAYVADEGPHNWVKSIHFTRGNYDLDRHDAILDSQHRVLKG